MSQSQQREQQNGSRRDDELGALWKKQNANGTFLTGTIEVDGKRIDIVVFDNRYKRSDNHPDYRILRSKPRDERQRDHDRSEAPSQRQSRNDGYGSRRHEGHPSNDQRSQAARRDHDDDIPF